jgi:hypothetical protein
MDESLMNANDVAGDDTRMVRSNSLIVAMIDMGRLEYRLNNQHHSIRK